MEGKSLEIRKECDYHHVKIMLETHGAAYVRKESKKEDINIPPGYLKIDREVYEAKEKGLRFHLDKVDRLGNFVGITPVSMENGNGKNFMKRCSPYLDLFGISEENFISQSYADIYKKRLGL